MEPEDPKKGISIFLRGLECVFSGVASTRREGRNSIHGGFCHE
jgi:hypothetical protein